jgi:gamma-glutamyltranspeptidase
MLANFRSPAPILLLALLATPSAGQGVARDPAIASDGRIAASFDGDLYVKAGTRSGEWRRVTSGLAWDRQPAWSADGRTLVFSSDRSGNADIWQVAATGSGAPVRLTTDAEPEVEPTALRDGSIVFVRGRDSQSRLWHRAADGTEKRLTTSNAPERWPAASPDGRQVAFIAISENGRSLRVRTIGATRDSTVTSERAPERPAWSPDGRRLAFSSQTPRPGVFVVPLDGRYVNYVSGRRGDPAWAPDGNGILIAERSGSEPGYNGDPDRVGDRSMAEVLSSDDRLVLVEAPRDLDRDSVVLAAAGGARRDRNREAFERFSARTERLYYSTPEAGARRDAWRGIISTLARSAESAADDAALESVMHEALAKRPPVREAAQGRAAVSSAHPVATTAGLEILSKGGNVVDAAVAVSFALGVAEPDASGIGGYGEMLVFQPGMAEPLLIEFMARVPEEATLSNASLQQNGRYPSDGPILAMVPGTVAAMHSAWKKFGSKKIPWADLVAPAIRAARDGYVVSDGLATTLMRERESFAKYESSRALFFRDGRPRIAGDTVRNPDLAWTLEQIAKGGHDGFYRGEVARRLVADLRGKGNAIQLTDLSRYFAADRAPVRTTYRGFSVFGSAPPASGGTILAGQLNNFEQYAIADAARRERQTWVGDAGTLHAMISAWQLVPSSRGRVADPALWPTDISPFVSKDTARARWRCFSPDRALTPANFRGDTLACADPARTDTGDRGDPSENFARFGDDAPCAGQDHAEGSVCRAQGTTSFVVADADGNVVAVTQTLGTWGGNFYVSPGLGFLYNDKLTSYGTDPGAYGARLPYARHGSTLSPTIVFRSEGAQLRPVLTVGAAGNAWINSAVYQTVVGVLDFGLSPQEALEQPRFLPGQRGNFAGPAAGGAASRQFVIDIEDGIAPSVIRRLEQLGHHFNRISLKGELRMGYGAAITLGSGSVTAGADPRRSGTAGAVP